jgi:hypothetical protein
MIMTKRQTDYIEDIKGNVYLPRPTNWLSGWLRSRWFKHTMGVNSRIASPEAWETLASLYVVRTLTEHQNGEIKIDEKR